MKPFLRQLGPAVRALIVLTVLTGILYPLVVTAVSQVAFSDEANGSLVKVDGVAVGSRLIGQQFVEAKYFHPRLSAAGSGYDGTASSGSNLGPSNADLLEAVVDRVAAYRADNGLADTQPVPADAVTSSASGLDPHISLANADLQAARVADARGLGVEAVRELIRRHIDRRPLGILGDPGVNVLELNLALDRAG